MESRRPCSTDEARAGLRALATLDGEWASSTVFPGEARAANATVLRWRRCARRAFRSYVCSLPTSSQPVVRGVDGEFGASPPTFAKFLARWALLLYVSTSHPQRPSRHVPPDLSRWAWLPGGCAGDGSWVQADVCFGRRGGQKGRLAALITGSSEGRALLARVSGDAGTAPGDAAGHSLRSRGAIEQSLHGSKLEWCSLI